jgi:hypothetical protein
MDKHADKLLKAFAVVCQKQGAPSSEHWDRLSAFTLYVHGRALAIDALLVREYLVRQGCSFQKANWASGEYRHFIELLRLYDTQWHLTREAKHAEVE